MSTPLLLSRFLGAALGLSWRSIGVIELVPCISLVLWACSFGWGGRGRTGGDGGVRRRAVLLAMFEPERVAPGWRGGRGLSGFRYRALRRVLGQLSQRHVVQFRGRLGSPESVHIKDGLPLFGFFVDGELGTLRNRSSHYDFRPRASAGLRW